MRSPNQTGPGNPGGIGSTCAPAATLPPNGSRKGCLTAILTTGSGQGAPGRARPRRRLPLRSPLPEEVDGRIARTGVLIREPVARVSF